MGVEDGQNGGEEVDVIKRMRGEVQNLGMSQTAHDDHHEPLPTTDQINAEADRIKAEQEAERARQEIAAS